MKGLGNDDDTTVEVTAAKCFYIGVPTSGGGQDERTLAATTRRWKRPRREDCNSDDTAVEATTTKGFYNDNDGTVVTTTKRLCNGIDTALEATVTSRL